MNQHSMFNTSGYSRQTRPATPSEETRNASYQAILSELSDRQRRYLKLIRVASTHGVEFKGKRLHDLTDAEASRMLDLPRSSINGRRDELLARNDRAATDVPVVRVSQKRKCHATGSTATAWEIVPTLFDQPKAA